MTLKEFLSENLISATPDQRSKLGRLLRPNTEPPKKKEDRRMVKDYPIEFLTKEETIDKILSFLKDVEFDKLSNTF